MSIVVERKSLKAEIQQRRKVVLPRLRKAVKGSQIAHRKRLKQCQSDCAAALRKAKQRATTARRKLEIAIRRAKQRARETCKACKVVDETGVNEIQASLEKLNKEKQEIDKLRAQAAMMISPRGRAGGRAAAEQRSESDDQVVRDLGDDKEMIALFKSVRAKIKPSKHRSRTEAFFEYLHDHPEALDELRAKREREWEGKAERLFKERQPDENGNSCWTDLTKCRRELDELKSAERFLKEAEVPF
jgi:hypothetical protein